MENNLIQIKEYAKPKKGEGGSGGKITYNINGADIGSSLKLKSLQANRILSDYIESNTVKAGTGDFVYLVASDGTISTLRGDNLDYSSGHIGDLTADSIETDKLKVNDTATIKNIFNDYLSSREIVTDYLTVNKAAHFFEVVIDKIRSVGGTIINTATNCVIDYVEPVIEGGITTGYKCYWKQTNNEDDYVSNDWLPNDQAISQNCNLVAGVNHNTGTHYYWRLVKEVSNTTTYVNFETGETSPGVLVDGVTIAPDYKVTFIPFDNEEYAFKYDNGQDDEEGSFPVTVTDWNISGQIIDEEEEDNWDEENNVLTVTDTLHGLQLIPNNFIETIDGVEREKYPNIRRGHFTFNTSVNTKLNVMIMFDDDTIEYHPTNGPRTAYDIEIKNVNNAIVTMIVITSDVVDVWHACHWIKLGNGQGEVDTPANDYVINGSHVVNWDNIPAKGDNIAQLGYRYQNLDGYENTKAWKTAHKDEVSRASAIIIAAYKTPDAGITPPSYAQYKNITDFNLASHRHTYFDANGSKFYGNFYVGPDTGSDDISDYTQISDLEAEVYKIVPNYDIITKDINDVITPSTLTCSFMVPNQSELVNVVPTGCVFNYWKDNGNVQTIAAGQPVSINISDLTDKLILQLAKLTGDSGQQGPQGSQGVQTQKILDQILKQVVEIDVANGEPGLNGGFTEWVYRNGVNGNNLPTDAVPFTELDNGWSKTAITPQDGQFTWCTTRDNIYVMSNNVQSLQYGNWQSAYRITGNNGKNGEDGDPGTAGKDGKYIEYIYKHFTTEQTFTNNDYNPANWDADDTQDYLGPTGYEWEDHPQGLGTIDNVFYEFEYMSQREFDGEHFGTFTEPVIWSRWGQNGQDGDGYEYIYKLSDEEPNRPVKKWNDNRDDNYPDDWSDDPQGVSSTAGETKEWVSMRKKENGTWGIYSYPALWAQYVPKGTNGGRYYFLYANYGASGSRPSIIPNGSAKYSVQALINAGWSLSVSTPDYANYKYTYMTQAFFNDGDTTSTWSVPARITGDNGKDGEDGSPGSAGANGKYIEFIYKHFTSKQLFSQNNNNPAYWDANQTPDYTGPTNYKWTDNPTGVNASYRYEYMSQREYDGTSFGKFTTPVIWSAFGEKGKDGDGFEYIYKRFTTAQTFGADSRNPAWWGASQNDEYLGPSGYEWSDDPVELTSMYKWEYMSYRKKENGTWSTYTNPILWLRYATDGAEGPQGPQGSAGRNGTNGTNGTSPIEYKLVDLGSTANVQMSLNDINNDTTQKLTVNLKFRVLICEGSTSRYMYGNEFNNMRVYYRMSQQSAGTSYYYRLLTLNSTSSSTIAQFTINYETTYDRIVQDNNNIIVSLVNSTTSTISDTQITSYYVYDTTNISVTLQSAAMINVVNNTISPSIRSLVTGQHELDSQYSSVTQRMDSVESEVTSISSAQKYNLFTDPNFYNTKNYWSFYHELASFWQKGSFTIDTYSSSTGARKLNLTGTTSTAYYIEQPIVLLPNTTYTLSFLYRDEGNASVNNGSSPLRFSFYSSGSSTSYPIIASHQTNDTLRWGQYDSGDYAYEFTFNCPSSTTAYERRYVTFTTSAQLPTTPIYFWLFTYTGSASVIRNTHIAELQLEQNSTYSAWTANSSYNSSLISQTANNITLQVQSEIDDVNDNIDGVESNIKNGLRTTGINIDTHNITLNADKTTINGQLEVNSDANGIKVSATTYNGGSSVTTYGYLTGGPIDSFSNWSDKVCNSSNAISRLGANGYEYISPWSNSGRKIYIGEEGIRLDSLNTAIQLSEYHLNKYVKDANFEYSTGYKYKPIDYKGIRILYVNSNGIYLNNSSGTRLAYSAREYTLSPYDEMIIIHGDYSCILTLPSPTFDWTGKTITIRNNSKKAIRLDSSMGFYSTYWSNNGSSYDNDSHDDYAYCNHLYVRAFGCTQLVYNYTYSNAMTGWHEITNGFSNTNRSDAARTVTQMDNGNGW